MAHLQITNKKRFFLFIVVILVLIGLLPVLWWGNAKLKRSGEVVIEKGNSAQVVWGKLADQNFTGSTLPWRYNAWRNDAASALQTGTYQLEEGESVADVIGRMVRGDTVPDELTVTYPEGFTLDQIATRTAAQGLRTREEFIAAAVPAGFAEQFPFVKELPAGRTLEGYLFPDTYRVFHDDTATDVIQRMLTNFDSKFGEDLRVEATTKKRTLDEIVIMASIIEREVIHDEDMALVSDVLWKRFDEGVGLGADATIRYAVNNWEDPLTVQQLNVDSPYNTRKYRGLPPGPISNPGLRALIAAVRPEASDFYYYLSTPTGETIFSKTNDEHNANKAKYLR